ncbi:MAG: DoxX family membrane protein [Patescibacteria group bacterium]
MKKSALITLLITCVLALTGIHVTFAHEVYVLDANEIHQALQSPIPDFIGAIKDNGLQFFSWGLGILVLIGALFFVSVNTFLERLIDPFLNKLKLLAPAVAQATLGLALLASGYYHAAYGIELPFGPIVGGYETVAAAVFMIVGAMLLFGILPRIAGLAATVIFIVLIGIFGLYILNYATYLAEALTVLFFGGGYTLVSVPLFKKGMSKKIEGHFHKYKFLIIRVFFGSSLIFASLYAKFFHGALALETVSKYHLTNYFPFDPVFLVLGAMLIEIMLGLFFILGFEIRFASIFFLVFLSMSLVFFGESVWPHIILIGTSSAMFFHGYDRYCLSAKLSKKKNLEPIL